MDEKKKRYGSSWFYEDNSAKYPTIEEQVALCRRIASQLEDDRNRCSKGAAMFNKRVKRSQKWTIGSDTAANDYYEQNVKYNDENNLSQISNDANDRRKNLLNLKLVLDPRPTISLEFLKKSGINCVEHDSVSPKICSELVRDLTSPEINKNRGAALFQKRQSQSVDWITTNEQVKQKLQSQYQAVQQLQQQQPQKMQQKPLAFAQPSVAATAAPFKTVSTIEADLVKNLQTIASSKLINSCEQTSLHNLLSTPAVNLPKFRNFNTLPRGFAKQ